MPKSHPVDITSLNPIQRMELADLLYDSAIAEIEQQMPHLTPQQLEQIDRDISRSCFGHSC